MKKRSLCIIPARGGSKRIPRKNIKEFLGKPIIAYSIEAAIKSGLFDEVMVSTDDKEIETVALEYGAKVPFLRSSKTSDDYAPLADVIKEVIETYAVKGIEFECLCCILPTAPLIDSKDLIFAYESLYEGSKYETVYTIVKYSYPIIRAVTINNDGFVEPINLEVSRMRTQDLPQAFHDAGMFYITYTDAFRRNNRLVSPLSKGLCLDEDRVQDIDTETDWKLAEIKYKLHHSV